MAASLAATDTPAHQPYVAADTSMPEFTISAVMTGALLGVVFAASSLYLVLKVGMTVSASIPVAVLAITLFRAFSRLTGTRQATILENNITQTAGSAGESIAFGVGVTMPALLILGFNMDLTRVMVVSVLGGLLGILAMIPLRRAFIVRLHGRPGQPGTLLYPEGTACAQVLISGEKGGTTGQTVFFGFGLAFLHKFVTEGMALLASTARLPFTFINRAAVFSSEMASELLGVGYIIGLRTSAIMMAGAVLGYLVIIPIIAFVGDYADLPVPPGSKPIKAMRVKEIRDNYLLFIGAGCVAAAGIFSMLRTLPMIVRGVTGSLAGLGQTSTTTAVVRRTDRDMPMSVVLLGSLILIALIAVVLAGDVPWVRAILGAALVVLFGFLFVTVSARLTGEIGSSSNPISGMTVATLMLTCLIFLSLEMTTLADRVLALTVAAIVCVASSNGGTTAQSLKTGFLVGGTPRAMQWAILIGALVSALVIGFTLLKFNEAGTIYSKKPENVPALTLTASEVARLQQTTRLDDIEYKVFDTKVDELTQPDEKHGYKPRPEVASVKPGRYLVDPQSGQLTHRVDFAIMGKLTQRDDGTQVNREFDAPKTQVMGIIINGVLKRDLNWSMVAIGAMIAIMLELCGVSALAFAVGVYVPIQFSVPIFLGGVVRWLIDSRLAKAAARDLERAGDDPERRAQAEIDAIRRTETSPGVLLASGYIAGGSLAGVLLAFTAFSNDLPRDLASWQYRTAVVGEELPLPKAAEKVAAENPPWVPSLPPQKPEELLAEIIELNEDVPVLWVKVPAGTQLTLPGGTPYEASSDTTLGELARQVLGREYKAQSIYDLNADRLQMPDTLPPQAALKLPQPVWPALLAFALLIGVLLFVGLSSRQGSPPA